MARAICKDCSESEDGDLETVGDWAEEHERKEMHDVQIKRVATDGGVVQCGRRDCERTETVSFSTAHGAGRVRCPEHALADGVDGIGDSRAEQLLAAFSIEDLVATCEGADGVHAPVALTNLDGIGPTTAATIAENIDQSSVAASVRERDEELAADGGTTIDRVMVDIETLGLEPGAAIVSIGAVRFDESGIHDTFERSVSLSNCWEDWEMDVDVGTLEWWLEQDEAAKRVLTGGEDLPEVLEAFSEWYDGADEIWANSPSFDCTLLEEAYARVGGTEPWAYHEERCFRTLADLPVAPELEHDGIEHDALDDAKHQALVAARTLQNVGGSR